MLACLGTIADVMPMLGDNRRIVKDGLHVMNDEAALQMLTPGLQQVRQILSLQPDLFQMRYAVAGNKRPLRKGVDMPRLL